MHFIGIDLAWKIPPETQTAVGVLDEKLKVVDGAFLKTDEEIAAFVKKYPARIVGIDAPLTVKNKNGARECDRLLLKKYGIPAYPANRKWFKRAFGGVRGEKLVPKLGASGAVMEVYPYATLKILLGEIPAYKKGRKKERVKGFSKLGLNLNSKMKLKELTQLADLLDAAVAAYTVYLYWKYGDAGCEILGDTENGFILIPKSIRRKH